MMNIAKITRDLGKKRGQPFSDLGFARSANRGGGARTPASRWWPGSLRRRPDPGRGGEVRRRGGRIRRRAARGRRGGRGGDAGHWRRAAPVIAVVAGGVGRRGGSTAVVGEGSGGRGAAARARSREEGASLGPGRAGGELGTCGTGVKRRLVRTAAADRADVVWRRRTRPVHGEKRG